MMHGELKVTKGDPTDEDLAALVAVLSAQTAKPEPRENRDRPIAGGWNSYWRNIRLPFVYGPEAWRGSYR